MPDPPPDVEESAPLLGQSPATQYGTVPAHERLLASLHHAAKQPVSLASRILLLIVLLLLLLCSIFIGLFVGLQSRVAHEDRGPSQTVTLTSTSTFSATATTTATRTTTAISTPTIRPEDAVCMTPECVRLSASILESIDEKTDPCEDFYQFATGGWSAKHILPTGQGSFSRLSELLLENHAVLRSSLADDGFSTIPVSDAILVKKLHDFYDSCTQLSELEAQGTKPLVQILNKTRSTLSGEQPRTEHLADALAYLHSIGVSAFFKIGVESDAGANPGFLVPVVSYPSLPLHLNEGLPEDSLLDQYKGLLQQLLLDSEQIETSNVWPPWPWPPWGDDKENSTAKALRLASSVVQIDKKIAAAIQNAKSICRDPICEYNPISLADISEAVQFINFTSYIASHTDTGLLPEKIIVTHPTYLRDISVITENLTDETLLAYLATRVSYSLGGHLSPQTPLWKTLDKIKQLTGPNLASLSSSRPDQCAAELDHLLGYASSRLYLNVTFSDLSRRQGYAIAKNITSSFIESVAKLSWMDQQTAEEVIGKASNIDIGIGYPLAPNIEDGDAIERFYQDLAIRNDSYFQNVVNARVHSHRGKWQSLGTYSSKARWSVPPSEIAPSFDREFNQLVIPMAMMHPPFFHNDWPRYITYGSFGMVVAHELLHGFDTKGQHYSANGTLGKWWSDATLHELHCKQQCLEEQYSLFEVRGDDGSTLHVDGNRTLDENFCDGGLIHAYHAWKAEYGASVQRGEESLLPGVSFTREQLFFISFAMQWAELISRLALQHQVETSRHSPHRFRVQGVLHNVPEFAQAFGCKATQNRGPVCLLWQ